MKRIIITIDDVRNADNNVAEAIVAWASGDDEYASGVCGPSFATSGPGSGWSRKFGADDFALHAITEGACAYVDSEDGRVATLVESDDEDEVAWTEESQVELECPSDELALLYPEALRAMALAVADYHGPKSDRKAWRALLESIQAAAEAVEGIEIEE